MIKQNQYEVHIINKIKEKYEINILSSEVDAIFDYTEIICLNNNIVKKGNIFTTNTKQNQYIVYEFTVEHTNEGKIISCLVIETAGGEIN